MRRTKTTRPSPKKSSLQNIKEYNTELLPKNLTNKHFSHKQIAEIISSINHQHKHSVDK